jgi:ABC-type multidrug transport system ATPase subunit
MKQRLRLAAAVLHDPPALLLDEPTSYLDTDGTARVEKFIREKMAGRIVVIATNNPEERHWCNRVVELGI